MTIQFAHFDPGPQSGMCHIDPGQRDILVQDRRPGGRGDHADLRPARKHRIAMTNTGIRRQVQPHEPVARVIFAGDQRGAPDKIIRF